MTQNSTFSGQDTAPAHPRVAVLMSTYNGAAWLEEQFDSLRAQDGGNRDNRCFTIGYMVHDT